MYENFHRKCNAINSTASELNAFKLRSKLNCVLRQHQHWLWIAFVLSVVFFLSCRSMKYMVPYIVHIYTLYSIRALYFQMFHGFVPYWHKLWHFSTVMMFAVIQRRIQVNFSLIWIREIHWCKHKANEKWKAKVYKLIAVCCVWKKSRSSTTMTQWLQSHIWYLYLIQKNIFEPNEPCFPIEFFRFFVLCLYVVTLVFVYSILRHISVPPYQLFANQARKTHIEITHLHFNRISSQNERVFPFLFDYTHQNNTMFTRLTICAHDGSHYTRSHMKIAEENFFTTIHTNV